MGHPVLDGCFEPQDVLPLPPAWSDGRPRKPVPRPPPPGGEHQACFLNERDYRERAKALIDALYEQERDREELQAQLVQTKLRAAQLELERDTHLMAVRQLRATATQPALAAVKWRRKAQSARDARLQADADDGV